MGLIQGSASAGPEDEVVQFRFWDDNDVMQKLVMEFTYRFDDVLDPEKLKSSLERLLQIGKWRQIGARFRKNVCTNPTGSMLPPSSTIDEIHD